MGHDSGPDITATLGQIPCGLFVLTSAYNGVRSGVLTRWVQPCSAEPPHVMVAVERGSAVEPLIRDSHHFALCQIADGDRLLLRTFSTPPERGEDPFVALPAHATPTGSPVIERALGYLDCELVRHIVLDADYRVYVGQVHRGAIMSDGTPAVEVAGNGWHENGATPETGGEAPTGRRTSPPTPRRSPRSSDQSRQQ
jgi:flavin reductase (DIM6/NTAB) family NADH-FMN oxidoreductase RutF